MLKIAMKFDERQYVAALTIAARDRQESVQKGMQNVAEEIVRQAQLRCPVSSRNLVNDYRIEKNGNGWARGLGNPWDGNFYNFKIIWGEKSDYSKSVDDYLEIGESVNSSTYAFDRSAKWKSKPTSSLYLRRYSVMKDRETQSQFGVKVGGKFLTRAFSENKKYIQDLQDEVFLSANRAVDRSKKTGVLHFPKRQSGTTAYASKKYKAKIEKLRNYLRKKKIR